VVHSATVFDQQPCFQESDGYSNEFQLATDEADEDIRIVTNYQMYSNVCSNQKFQFGFRNILAGSWRLVMRW
jgi:hypothetical protein